MNQETQIHEAAEKISAALAGHPRRVQISAVEHNLLMHDLQLWVNGGMVLERNDCSRLHKLCEAARDGRITDSKFHRGYPDDALNYVSQTFVVKHDWASAFDDAAGMAEEFKLPYDFCAFEFRLSGRTVIAVAAEAAADEERKFTAFTQINELWCGFNVAEDSESKATRFVYSQIRAICIALDAEVATHSVVRAPARLNEKRAKAGKVPLRDFHVVDLARRHRIANPAHGDGGTKKRLHFRRGHWRHFEQSKTWVKWCLVGNPDLGFISKHYSL